MKPIASKPHTLPIASIRIGQRHRKDVGDIRDITASIGELGLLHPVVIRPDGTLIAGERRLHACKALGWTEVPVNVVPIDDIVKGEFAENAHRKDFLPSEIDAIRRALEPIEKAAAKARMIDGARGVEIFHTPPGKTRDKIAAFAGVSGRTLDKISAVVEAAEADPRFQPLVKRMDQTGHVHSAFKQLTAMRAEPCKEPLPAEPSTRISVAAYNEAFSDYPPIHEHNGWIYGVWLCGTSWHKSRLYGEYPPTFLKRALALFPGASGIVHCPSGTVLGPGLTIDLVRDDVRCPQIVADAAALPVTSGTIDLVLSDPPYSEGDSKKYGCPPFPMSKFMREAWRVLRPGGHLGMLHAYYPTYKKNNWKLVGTIAVLTGPYRATRLFSIFERL